MAEKDLQKEIDILSSKIQELQNIERRIIDLESRASRHRHYGYDKSKNINGYIWNNLIASEELKFGYEEDFGIKRISSTAMSFDTMSFGSIAVSTVLGAGFTLTPTSSTHNLSATGAVTSDGTTAITNGQFEGQLLFLRGSDDTNTITIQDGANVILAGAANVVLGEDDTVSFLYIGSNWCELSRSDN